MTSGSKLNSVRPEVAVRGRRGWAGERGGGEGQGGREKGQTECSHPRGRSSLLMFLNKNTSNGIHPSRHNSSIFCSYFIRTD